ncbi:MAG: hypothetical protein H7Y42_00800 [Chitinophagaceae bacterium]|nr:hypothetical protein [Chitinophagaceae bacterium]
MRHAATILVGLILFAFTTAMAQEDESKAGRLSPKELTIPPSPVFDMMGVTSSQINRTSDIKDFKVDWSFKSWRLNPNLAIQSQPIWELLYNRKELSKYQKASGFMRRLASFDVSIGSVQDENNDRRIGFAGKLNLFKQRDPLLARDLYAGISEKFKKEKEEIEAQLKELRVKLDTTSDILAKPSLRAQIRATEEQLFSINSRRNEEINGRAKIFVGEHWNASSLDVAFGKVYTYQTDSAGSLKSLRLNRNTGWSGWLNGNLGIGKKFLLTGLFRASWYEEELDFLVRNNITGEEISQKAVADNTLWTMGMNLRYGSSIYTFFFEFLYEKKGLKTPLEALGETFKAPGDFQVVGSTVKWDVVHPNTLSFGGDWRLSRSVILNYGMRCVFDGAWKFRTFTPIATISCMMR